jgi:glycosyltransferase involved in cell wall biosynthesis
MTLITSSPPILYSVVVPIYNSESVVEELVKRIEVVMGEIGSTYEIILVDDCSVDGVWKRILAIAAAKNRVRGLRLSNNYGQWMATLAGMSRSEGANIITIDDDLEYDPTDIKALIKTLESSDYYLVFGLAPEKYNVKGKNVQLAKVRNKALNFFWQKILTDSFKILKRELVFTPAGEFYPKVHFEAFINFNLHARFVGYAEVNYSPRFHGSSNHTLWKRISLLVKYSLEYYKYPSKGLSLLLVFVLLLAMFLEYLLFRGKLNGLLLAVMSFVQACILLLILQYAAHIYLSVKKIPEYWIIETTPVI